MKVLAIGDPHFMITNIKNIELFMEKLYFETETMEANPCRINLLNFISVCKLYTAPFILMCIKYQGYPLCKETFVFKIESCREYCES